MSEQTAPMKADAVNTNVITQNVQRPIMPVQPEGFATFDLDSLIPQSLKDAEAKSHEGEESAAPIQPPEIQSPDAIVSPNPVDDLDAIVNSLIPEEKPQTDDEAPPFWQEDENYKELLNHLNYSGVPLNLLNKFAQTIADKSTIDNGKLVNGFETENKTLKDHLEELKSEVIRLREVEREAYFEALPETEQNFSQPMQNSAKEIKNILDLEGSNTPLSSILMAPNKAELVKVLKNLDLDGEQTANLTAQWRLYKETQQEFEEAKKNARQSLKGKLDIRITPDKATDVMRKVLLDATASEDQFKYIRTGIDEGLDKHEHVGKVLANAQSNFQAIAAALSDPHAVTRSPKELQKIAKFMLNSAHNGYLASQFPDLQAKYEKQQGELLQIAKAYRELKKAAGGSTKASGGPMLPNSILGNGAAPKDTSSDDAKVFQDFLAGKVKIEELLS